MKITGAQALIKSLEAQEVKKIFGYPGGAVLGLYDALLQASIEHILVRHEQWGVHAASGYAKATGEVGVCMSTSGPGATNLVTGLATAYVDSVPLVAITGQVATGMIGTDAFQEVDITGITLPMTKHNYLVKSAEDIPRILKEAFHIAKTGRPGPVLIDIPKNIADSLIDYVEPDIVELRGYKPNTKGHPAQIKQLAKMIAESERPVIYTGGGVVASNANDLLVQLAEKASIPVTTTLMGIGAISDNHPLNIGMLGLHGVPAANIAVTECDLLIGIGVRFDDRVTGAVDKFAPNATIVHLDIDPAEIGKNVSVDLPIVGDIGNILEQLLDRTEAKEHPDWVNQVNMWKDEYQLTYQKEELIKPQQIISAVSELTGGNAIVTSDVGQHQMWVAHYYKFDNNRSFICSGGLGTMGYGFPAAIGAQIGQPDKTVISITGDGGFQMNLTELATAIEQKLPIKVLILNNNTLGMVKQLQHFYCDKRYNAINFTGNPDFVKLAESYGAAGYRIKREEEIIPTLTEVFNNDRLTVVDCVVSNEELVFPMVMAGMGIGEMVTCPEGEEQ